MPAASRPPAHGAQVPLTGDGVHNRAMLAAALAAGPVELWLPPGRYPLVGGLVVDAGRRLCGAGASGGSLPAGQRPGTWLYADGPGTGEPMLHVLGSEAELCGIGLEPAPSNPGQHGGDRGTAVTVGRYLYPAPPEWVEHVRLVDLHVRARGRGANSVAVMGACSDVEVHGLTVTGGATGLAVHWGAVGSSVSELAGPTYHPHRLLVNDLTVSDAFEGFYLSSVHDVLVEGGRVSGVDVGFRLLAGDNTDRFHPGGGGVVGRRIVISHVTAAWRGRLYGMRIAGWGRSEVDGVVTTLDYEDVEVSDCVFVAEEDPAAPLRPRTPIVLERPGGAVLRDVGARGQRARPGAEPEPAASPERARRRRASIPGPLTGESRPIS